MSCGPLTSTVSPGRGPTPLPAEHSAWTPPLSSAVCFSCLLRLCHRRPQPPQPLLVVQGLGSWLSLCYRPLSGLIWTRRAMMPVARGPYLGLQPERSQGAGGSVHRRAWETHPPPTRIERVGLVLLSFWCGEHRNFVGRSVRTAIFLSLQRACSRFSLRP